MSYLCYMSVYKQTEKKHIHIYIYTHYFYISILVPWISELGVKRQPMKKTSCIMVALELIGKCDPPVIVVTWCRDMVCWTCLIYAQFSREHFDGVVLCDYWRVPSGKLT